MAKVQTQETQTPNINLIGKGTMIIGDLKANGDIRIDGTLNGKLHGKGRVVIGPSGSVEGEIKCQNMEVSGNVKGQIAVSDLLSLKASAKVNGDIQTSKISIEPGAMYTGNCSMASQAAPTNTQYSNIERKEEQRDK
ncbi:MAG: cell shape determination protein CcmA [Marinilabiliales bacterium]|nr:MAG: cell shape determination protein CcmA [Marinilabiliales bacterium]